MLHIKKIPIRLSVMNNPELSIVVPVYNVDEWLEECLKSIQNQTFTNWECILVDDGSKDWSGTICDNYSKKDKRFCVVHQENKGVSAARNVGIDKAKGNYISFIDPDDYISTNFYSVMIDCSQITGAECVCSNRYFVINDEESPVLNNAINLIRGASNTKVFAGKEVVESFRLLLSGGPWGYIFKSELWKKHRFPLGIDFAEDLAVIPLVIAKSKIAAFTPEAIYFYRKRLNSLMTQPVDKDRFIRCLKASNMMFDTACIEYPEQSSYFSNLKLNSDIGRFMDYLKGKPSVNGSKLYELSRLMKEAEKCKIEEEK